jgi:hypothetical protein
MSAASADNYLVILTFLCHRLGSVGPHLNDFWSIIPVYTSKEAVSTLGPAVTVRVLLSGVACPGPVMSADISTGQQPRTCHDRLSCGPGYKAGA